MAFRRQSRQRTNILVVCAFTLFLWFTFRSSFFSSSTHPRVPPVKLPEREPPSPPPPPPADSKPEIKHNVEPKVEHKVEPEVNAAQRAKPKAQAVLEPPKGKGLKKHGDDDVEMVIASMQRENITWLHDYLKDWKKNIYVVDDPKARLTVPTNKGREAMVFLTYIIDRYDSLPGNIIFHHAERFQWHNDNPDYDALTLLQRFRFDNLKEQGYVNLRCVWVLGCPAEIHPIRDESPPVPNEAIHARHVYKPAFQELFPNTPVPETIGVTCCSQFAVRREVIKKRPRADYVRYRDWLMTSDLPDDLSGRVLEYSWHVMFGKNAVHCPNAGDCYCRTYGLCDLKCNEKGCGEQYTLPRFSTLPKGWPKLGWKGEDRHWSGPE